MLHFALLLHLFSFTTGIIAITSLGWIYQKNKTEILGIVIKTDILFTLVLLFDSISYYLWLSRADYPVWVYLLLVVSQYSAIVWKTYFCIKMIFRLIDREISKQFKMFGIGICYGILIYIYILFQFKILIPERALIIAFSVMNVIAVSGSLYCVIFGWVRFDLILNELKPVVRTCLIALAVVEPFSIAQNMLRTYFSWEIPGVSMSAILYFILNGAGLYYLSRYTVNIPIARRTAPRESGYKTSDQPAQSETADLTPREREIMMLIADGCSNREISAALFISENTVKNHIYNIYKKIGIKNRIELLNYIKNVFRHN